MSQNETALQTETKSLQIYLIFSTLELSFFLWQDFHFDKEETTKYYNYIHVP